MPENGWHKGVLVANAFLKTDKFVEHYVWLREAAKQYQIALSLLDNTGLLYPLGSSGHGVMAEKIGRLIEDNDFILYWEGCCWGCCCSTSAGCGAFRYLILWRRLRPAIINLRLTGGSGSGTGAAAGRSRSH